jgi:hypothetical protein
VSRCRVLGQLCMQRASHVDATTICVWKAHSDGGSALCTTTMCAHKVLAQELNLLSSKGDACIAQRNECAHNEGHGVTQPTCTHDGPCMQVGSAAAGARQQSSMWQRGHPAITIGPASGASAAAAARCGIDICPVVGLHTAYGALSALTEVNTPSIRNTYSQPFMAGMSPKCLPYSEPPQHRHPWAPHLASALLLVCLPDESSTAIVLLWLCRRCSDVAISTGPFCCILKP